MNEECACLFWQNVTISFKETKVARTIHIIFSQTISPGETIIFPLKQTRCEATYLVVVEPPVKTVRKTPLKEYNIWLD